jgi:2'-5' RNA ligase
VSKILARISFKQPMSFFLRLPITLVRRTTMKERSIHIQPKFRDIELIENVRKKYDPLFHLIPPHITIIFPFKSNITTEELKTHVASKIANQRKFEISLKKAISFNAEDSNVYFKIDQGKENILTLHDLLYSDLLEQYKDYSKYYTPHLTIGNLSNHMEGKIEIISRLNECFENIEFVTHVTDITCEIIDDDQKSIVDFIIGLQ